MELSFFAKLIRKSITDQWDLMLIDRLKVIQKLGQTFGTQAETEKTIKVIFKETDLKTREELGYFHAEVLPKLVLAYNEIGYPIYNEIAAKDQLKYDFGYYENYQVFDRSTGEIIETKRPKSFSKAGKKEMAKIIDFAIMICNEAGIEVETPENYKLKNGVKSY